MRNGEKVEKYLEQYKNINKQFEKIISQSLQGANLRIHAKAAVFTEDYELWIKLAKDSYEEDIYKQALEQYKAMLLFWNMGLYKYAFIALRGYFELTLFAIQLSTCELDYRMWKNGELDLYWSDITDCNKGIFSPQFVKAFQPSFVETSKLMINMSKCVYRECSEYIHSNYITSEFLPEETSFNQQVFEDISNKTETINKVITFGFTMRYLEKIIKQGKLQCFENSIMENIGNIPCISEIYK